MSDSPPPTLRRGGGRSAQQPPPAWRRGPKSMRASGRAPAQRLLAAALLLLTTLVGVRAQPPALMPQPSAELPGEEQCAVSIHYDVSLGSGGSRQYIQKAPIFTGTVTIQNNGNETIEEWRMGWAFPFGSSIKSQDDVWTPDILLDTPDQTTVTVDSTNLSLAVLPDDLVQFGFLGTKTSEPSSNPFKVGPLTNVVINNLFCRLVQVPKALPAPVAPPGSSDTAVTDPQILQIDYAPYTFVGQPQVTTFTGFLARARNIGDNTTVDMATVSLGYFFAGPEGGVPMSAVYSPDEYFEAHCEVATSGCDNVILQVLPGYEGLPGSRYYVNISFAPGAGMLLPTGANAVPQIFLGNGTEQQIVVITIRAKVSGVYLNSTQDYSYLNTTALPPGPNATVVPRQAQPNDHIPAYIGGTLVWGRLPIASQDTLAAPLPASEAEAVDGVTCETPQGGGQQTCGLSAVYCCSAPEPVTPVIPEVWPPSTQGLAPSAEQPLPPGLEAVPGSAGGTPSSTPSSTPVSAASTPPPVPASGGGGGSSNAGLIAGVAAGAAAAAVGLLAGLLLMRRRRRRRQQQFLAGVGDKDYAASNGDVANGGGPGHSSTFPAGAGLARQRSSAANGSRNVQLSAAMVDMASNQKPLVLWHGNDARAGSDTASVHSSPSKASNQPLLGLQQRSNTINSHLIKFPSGMSGVSSTHDNPVFETGFDSNYSGGGGANGHWDGPGGAAGGGSGSGEGDDGHGCSTALLAFLERKAATVGTMSPDPSAHVRGRISTDGGGATASSPQAPLASWQLLRRTRSWAGVLTSGADSPGEVPHLLMRRRKTVPALQHAPPPLATLAPPVLRDSDPVEGVDLAVDYEQELQPFLGRCLGTGGFGAVYEAEWRGRRVAVKKLPPFSADAPITQAMFDALLREIELASKFNSDRLVKVYGACTRDTEHIALIMELMEGGNLFQRIYDRNKRRMGYLEILQLAHEMATGLAYLHPSVVHRDLKPQNVLLDKEGHAVLADFGISRVKDPTKSYLSSVTNDNGTPQYMAPEQFNGARVDEKVDVYALGVILNEAYTRRPPWRESTHFFQIILKVAINGERPWMDPDCPEPLRRLITKCWHQDPHMRPSCAEIMRLTDCMLQEELRRWEALSAASNGNGGGGGGGGGNGGGLHVQAMRLPVAPGAGQLGVSPRAGSSPAAARH